MVAWQFWVFLRLIIIYNGANYIDGILLNLIRLHLVRVPMKDKSDLSCALKF